MWQRARCLRQKAIEAIALRHVPSRAVQAAAANTVEPSQSGWSLMAVGSSGKTSSSEVLQKKPTSNGWLRTLQDLNDRLGTTARRRDAPLHLEARRRDLQSTDRHVQDQENASGAATRGRHRKLLSSVPSIPAHVVSKAVCFGSRDAQHPRVTNHASTPTVMLTPAACSHAEVSALNRTVVCASSRFFPI